MRMRVSMMSSIISYDAIIQSNETHEIYSIYILTTYNL